ncbi:MAG: hypothetical protein PHF97_09245 [Bacteroidales bacterium]|nr:hypothetical protein [Bacteroidales bacterium]
MIKKTVFRINRTACNVLLITSILFFSGFPSMAQEKEENGNLTELSKQTQNPVANMYQVPLSYVGDFNSGPDKLFVSTLNLKPVIPIDLSKSLLFIFRAIIPITFMPAPESKSGLSDIQLQFYLSPKNKSKFIWGVGPLLSMPSGIPADLCSGKWTLGPNAAALVMLKKVVFGALVTQRWTVAGDGSMPEINQLYANPYVNYNFHKGWALGYSPEFYVDWTKATDNWNWPVGLVASKVFRIGKQPFSANLSYYYNVIRPENYTDMYIKAGITLLIPKK